MKLIYVMDIKEIIEREAHVGDVYWRKDKGTILKNINIMKLGGSFNELLHSFLFNNQHTPNPNVSVIGNLVFLVILAGKEHSSTSWFIKCMLHSKEW